MTHNLKSENCLFNEENEEDPENHYELRPWKVDLYVVIFHDPLKDFVNLFLGLGEDVEKTSSHENAAGEAIGKTDDALPPASGPGVGIVSDCGEQLERYQPEKH